MKFIFPKGLFSGIGACVLSLALLLSIAMAGCSSKIDAGNLKMEEPPAPPQDALYKIVSISDYNNSLCTSTSFSQRPGGFNSGLHAILKDKETGQVLEGRVETMNMLGGGSGPGDGYSCEEQIDSPDVLVSAYVKGYAPASFIFTYPKNKLVGIEVFMTRSCSGGQSCFGNAGLFAQMMGDENLSETRVKEAKMQYNKMIQEQFGLSDSDYTLQCAECNLGRGGFIKANGTFKDGSPFEMYYHWGWCSSGGADCGTESCFSTSSKELERIIGARNASGTGCLAK